MVKHGYIVQPIQRERDPKKYAITSDDLEHGFTNHRFHCEGTGQRALTGAEDAVWYERFMTKQQAVLDSMPGASLQDETRKHAIRKRMLEMPKPRSNLHK
jgi:hypothetical protein